MNNSAQITVAALVAAATTGFATAGSLELDRSYAAELKADAGARSVLSQGNVSNLTVHAGVRFGYTYNNRGDDGSLGDDDTTIGFGFHQAEIAVEGDVTDNMRGRVSFDFGPDNSDSTGGQGTATLEDAYVDWDVNDDFSLRVGQFIPAYSAEASTSEFHMTNPYRSVTHEFLGTPSWTQGVQATFGGDTWDFSVGFSDGFNTSNTAFNNSAEADFALNARFDLFGDSNKDRFADQTSWRGSASGWRAGAGLLWATYGDTNPSGTEIDNLFFTVDGAYEGDGWAVNAAFYFASIDPDGGTEHENMGVELGGSFFLTDQWEAFARWDILLLDDDAGAGQVAASGEDTQNFLSLGANYYFVPESHAAKLTIAAGLALDETADIVNTTGDTGTTPLGAAGYLSDVAGEDGQFMLSAVMQWMF